MTEPVIFDMRDNQRWGNSVEKQWGQDDWTKIQGCLTPLPKTGDFIIAGNGYILAVDTVKPMGNPRDGFFADTIYTKCQEGDGDTPSVEEIQSFMRENCPEVVLP